GIAADPSGNAYVVGSTTAADFPTVNAFQSVYAGGARFADGDAFIAKINPAGSAFVFSTYLGGHGSDRATGVAVSSTGEAWVVGFSSSGNFPLQNAFQSTRRAAYKAIYG